MNDLLRKTRRAFHLLRELLKYETATCCAAVLKCWNKDYRHVWLVSERGREARDNGYHIFAYLNREHPELNSWFVADPTLSDYERVQALGRVVPYRSWKHYLLCAASEMKISTHVLGYTPEIDSYYMLDKLHVVHGPRAFLQHGVIIDDMKWYHYPNIRTDLFVCSLQKERDFVESAYHYPDGIVKRLGLCRFDALLRPHETKRQLLLMPTWRTYAIERKTQAEFEQSDYFRHWQDVISSPELEALLEKHGYEAVFYPHFEVQRFLSSFHTANPRVKIAALGEADVQTLLMESAVMVSDFSSVQFDFAYMKSPSSITSSMRHSIGACTTTSATSATGTTASGLWSPSRQRSSGSWTALWLRTARYPPSTQSVWTRCSTRWMTRTVPATIRPSWSF